MFTLDYTQADQPGAYGTLVREDTNATEQHWETTLGTPDGDCQCKGTRPQHGGKYNMFVNARGRGLNFTVRRVEGDTLGRRLTVQQSA